MQEVKVRSQTHQKEQPFLQGVLAASLTPCQPDLTCDNAAMAEHCKDLIARGCCGVVIFGTTGEGSSFSVEEKKKTLKALIELGINAKQMILGVGNCAIPDAVELSKEALKQECAAVLMIPPFFYNQVDDEGVISFYREVITRVQDSRLRLILYHIPQFSRVPITLPVIHRLVSEFPEQVIGIKDSEGNMELFKEIRQQFPHFHIYAGNEALIAEAARMGAAGAIVGMANVFPELLRSLYTYGKGISQNNPQQELMIMRDIVRRYPFIPAMKSFMGKRKGNPWHTLRPPLIPLTEEQGEAFEQELGAAIAQLHS